MALAELYAGDQGLSWSDVLRWISTIKEDDLVSGAFVLGIESSGVLSRLATFARTVLANSDLAEALAKVAVKMGPQNAVALTNLARGLVATGDMSKIVEAERIIEKVPNFADRRFRWWRAVRREIKGKLYPNALARKPKDLKPCDDKAVFTEFDQLIHRLDNMAAINAGDRSLQFGYIIKGLVQLTAGTELIRDRLEKSGEIDVQFMRMLLRLVPLWKDGPITIEDISQHLEGNGIAVVISTSEFGPEFSEWQSDGSPRNIALVGRRDCEGAIREYLNFDEILSRSLSFYRAALGINASRLAVASL